MSTLRDAAQKALQALEDHTKQYPHMEKGYTVDAITALRTALADQHLLRGEWQGYTWNPYAIPQPAKPAEQEPVEATPYNLKCIAGELERTAVGEDFYGNALRVAKDIPDITPEDRSVLDRYATGTQTGTDHVKELRHLHNEVRVLAETLQRCKEIGNSTAECYRLDLERDEALLRQALDLIETMPVKHPDQITPRNALIVSIKNRLQLLLVDNAG